MMKQAFPSIVEPDFTANVESLLDMVEEGKVSWKTVVSNFYPDLEEAVKKAEEDLEKVQIRDEVSDVVAMQCGRNMVVKYGPHGKFLACPGFPECRNTKPYLEKIGVKCPKCGKRLCSDVLPKVGNSTVVKAIRTVISYPGNARKIRQKIRFLSR